jgi:hypothetical protein
MWLIGSTVPEVGMPVIAYQEREVRRSACPPDLMEGLSLRAGR